MVANENSRLRILFIVGSLGKGGAEKQLLYILRAMKRLGAGLKILALSGGAFYEQTLRQNDIPFELIGGFTPPMRMAAIVKEVRVFKPHFIQATHFFASFYAGVAGRITGIPSIGAIRGDFHHDQAGIGKAAGWLVRLPNVFIANSYNARENFLQQGFPSSRVHVLQNVIDLKDFDRQFASPPLTLMNHDRRRVITVARLVPVKRLERFLTALAIAREKAPELEGIIVGTGPEEGRLNALANQLDLGAGTGGVHFLGERSDIPQLLAQAILFVLTSDREGFPNVILEAMAASLPVLTTPAGESRVLVEDGVNGYHIPFEDPTVLANRLVELTHSPAQRRLLGNGGRRIVESRFSHEQLAAQLIAVYTAIAQQTKNHAAMQALSSNGTANLASLVDAPLAGSNIQRDQ